MNENSRKTSDQKPYHIINIAHFKINENVQGRLALSIAPGKKDTRWNRDLKKDLDVIKANGIQVIVCLLEWSEMQKLKITEYPTLAQGYGFVFYHLPIKDMGVPNQKDIDVLIPILIQHLFQGQNILVHCKGGLGRAGTISACCLGHFGYEGLTAINMVRMQRPKAIQTDKQEECVVKYCLKHI